MNSKNVELVTPNIIEKTQKYQQNEQHLLSVCVCVWLRLRVHNSANAPGRHARVFELNTNGLESG